LAPYSYKNEAGELVEVPEERKRYTIWPSVKHKLPCHYYAAAVLLGMPATSVANESIHSIAAYVMNKLRSRLTNANHEALTLAKIMLERSLKEKKLDKIIVLEQHIKLYGYLGIYGAARRSTERRVYNATAVTAHRRGHRHRHCRGARRLRYPLTLTAIPHCIEYTGHRPPPDLPPTVGTLKYVPTFRR
jgi:hypothetical protein